MNQSTDHIQLQHWIRTGDADAFNDLAQRYSGIVFGTCFRITRNRSEAEDAAQECFEALARIPEVPRTPIGAWLHSVATNRALNRIRARKRREKRETLYVAENSQTAETRWTDIDVLVDEAIAELPDELRVPILAHFLEGESYTAVAQSLGISRQAVTKRVKKGIQRLRETLRKRGVPVSLGALMSMMSAGFSEAAAVPTATSAVIAKMALAGTIHQTSAGAAVSGASVLSATLGTTIVGGTVMTKATIASIGVAAAIVGAGVVYTVSNSGPTLSVDEETKLASDTYDVTADQSLDLRMAAMQEELDQTQAERDQLREALALAEARNGEAEPEIVADEAAHIEDEEESEQEATLDEIRAQLRGSRSQSVTASIYDDFLSAFEWDTGVKSDVVQLLHESLLEEMALKRYASKKEGVTFRELRKWVSAEQGFLNDQLQSTLSEEAIATWNAHYANMDIRHSKRIQEMRRGFTTMTPESLDAFIQVYGEERRTQLYAIEQTNALYTHWELDNLNLSIVSSTRDRLQEFLAPEEIAPLDNWVTDLEVDLAGIQ